MKQKGLERPMIIGYNEEVYQLKDFDPRRLEAVFPNWKLSAFDSNLSAFSQ